MRFYMTSIQTFYPTYFVTFTAGSLLRFPAALLIIYLAAINLAGFLSMFIDKQRARKHRWRIPETLTINQMQH